jgi:hypothetical protein
MIRTEQEWCDEMTGARNVAGSLFQRFGVASKSVIADFVTEEVPWMRERALPWLAIWLFVSAVNLFAK